jgi:SAM-dependent methyltransferase
VVNKIFNWRKDMKSDDIKKVVKEKYGEIAKHGKIHSSCSCCSSDTAADVDYTFFSEDYSKLEGYNPDADLGLGCGIPTDTAKIKPGDTVIDLGSGAGNDVFVARRLVGETGRVIGIDMTQEMIEKAQENNRKLGYANVEFRFGEIENLPVDDNTADVVISNCVLNLVPSKLKAYQEIYRVLKSGGHFSISDIVLTGILPAKIQAAAEMYAGCVAGALKKEDYINCIRKAGFSNISVVKKKPMTIPDIMLSQLLSVEEFTAFKNSGSVILSITVYGQKPEQIGGGRCCCD